MAINYTSVLNLPQIDFDHDGAESAAAMIAAMTALDALFTYFVVDEDGDIITDDNTGQPIIDI